MKVYRVEGGPLQLGPGTLMMLTGAQAETRAHNLAFAEKRGEAVLARNAAMLTFKVGEVLGLAVIDKATAQRVVPSDGKGAKKKSAEAVLIAAVQDLEDQQAAAEAHAAEQRRNAEAAKKAAADGAQQSGAA
jgi:exosome complex RNA-binding protein Csl4